MRQSEKSFCEFLMKSASSNKHEVMISELLCGIVDTQYAIGMTGNSNRMHVLLSYYPATTLYNATVVLYTDTEPKAP